jgi:oxygen-independent coproporphyrinogen-3 oxidase
LSAGIYIHIPFCLTKCGYCSFFSVPFSSSGLESYVTTLKDEIGQFKQKFGLEADTVYFGGGTPSLLAAQQINSILDLIQPPADAEITLEVNPVQVTSGWVKALKETEVNRLSLGVQSLSDENLQALGRKHTAGSITDRMKLLRDNGYDNISMDLIYGLPYFSEYRMEEELNSFLALDPEHLSTYLLTIEDNVPYSHWKKILPDDQTTQLKYETICSTLIEMGWEQYEISNFARPGKASRHNLHYWLADDYYGLGAGASGFLNNQRYKRPEDIQLWEFSVQKGDILYEKETETLTQQKADFIIMQLRLARGLELAEYKRRFGTDFITDFNDTIEQFITSGHLEHADGFIKITPGFRFVSNRIMQEFV